MKALVTGGTGFIGSHLVEELLSRDWDVQVLAIDKMYGEELDAPVAIADCSDTDAMAELLPGVDVVFHLAGVTRARHSRDYYTGNHEATRSLLKSCAKHGDSLKRFLFVSSLTAVGPRLGPGEVTESTVCHPVSHYGRSKMLAELEVMRSASRFPVTIVRPGAVFGPRERDLYRYFKMIRAGIQLLLGSGQQEMNLVHVDDFVRGTIRAAEHPAAENEIFFIGDCRNYTSSRICQTIAEAVDKSPLVFKLPVPLLYIIGAAGEGFGRVFGRDVFFNVQKVREAVQDAWTCSSAKARDAFGYVPAIALSEGISSTYDWYRKHGWL